MEITNVKFELLKDQVRREQVFKGQISLFAECVGVGLGLGMAIFGSWLVFLVLS